jgi:hypothetical protein
MALKNENFKIENLACKMLDLFDELKAADESYDNDTFKRKLQYAKTATDIAKVVLECKKEETNRARLIVEISSKSNLDNTDDDIIKMLK